MLIVAGSIFATRPPYKPREEHTTEGRAEGKAPDKIESYGFLGAGPDAWTAIFTGVLTLFTAVLAGTAIVQIRFLVSADETARRSADAALRSADVATQTLIASNRAWIKVTAISLTEGLTVRIPGARTMVALRMQNIGNTPAVNIRAWIRLGAIRPGGTHIEQFHRECRDIVRFPPPGEFSIFPGDTFPPTEALAFFVGMSRQDFEDAIFERDGVRHFHPLVLGCVLYQFPSNPGRYHQTRFIHSIMRQDGEPISIEPHDIALGQLRFGPISLGEGDYAD